MTQEEVIELARQADDEADNVLNMKGEYHPNWHQVRDEIFAKLVAEREREACLEICKERMKDAEAFCKRVGGEYHEGRWNGAVQIEKRILERNSQ